MARQCFTPLRRSIAEVEQVVKKGGELIVRFLKKRGLIQLATLPVMTK